MTAGRGCRTGRDRGRPVVGGVRLDGRVTVHDIARRLPDIAVLRDHCRALAMAEAVLNPEGSYRRHHFAAHWSRTEELASMETGSGDEYSVVFSPAGAWVRGFDHESPMSPYVDDRPWPGVLDEVPEVFRRYVEEPAFCGEDGLPYVTACLWREPADSAWRAGTIAFPEGADDPDGSAYLFGLLVDRSPEAFADFARDYYGRPVDPAAVRHVLALRPLTDEVVAALNPAATLAGLAGHIAAIGYPRAR